MRSHSPSHPNYDPNHPTQIFSSELAVDSAVFRSRRSTAQTSRISVKAEQLRTLDENSTPRVVIAGMPVLNKLLFEGLALNEDEGNKNGENNDEFPDYERLSSMDTMASKAGLNESEVRFFLLLIVCLLQNLLPLLLALFLLVLFDLNRPSLNQNKSP